jgi:hypothetical protein
MLAKSVSLIILILALGAGRSFAGDDPWFFTTDAMADAYRYQRQFGARLRNPLQAQGCYYGQSEFTAAYRGEPLVVPCRFISETTRQLKQLLSSGAAKYLFPLDVGYASLAVPADVYARKYAQLPLEDILAEALREPTLAAVYRTAAHANGSQSRKQISGNESAPKFTVIGFYDGRQNQSLPQGTMPQGFVELGGFYLLEHFLSELTFIVDQRVVTLDFSFENDYAEAPSHKSMVRVSKAVQ